MLKLASALVAVLLVCSPALATKKTTVAPPAPAAKVCGTADEFAGQLSDKVIKRFDGAEVKAFSARLEKKLDADSPQRLPADITSIVVLKPTKEGIVIFAVFVKGCYKGLGIASRKTLPEFFDGDDGSI